MNSARVNHEVMDLQGKRQTIWKINHAIWFFTMGSGGALYIERWILGLDVGTVFGASVIEILSLALVAIGGAILIIDLGRPTQFLRALSNVNRSWISIGAVADFVFLIIAGGLVASFLNFGGYMPFQILSFFYQDMIGTLLLYLAGSAAFIVMVYAGIVLALPRSIPFWHTPLIPLQFLAYSLSSGVALAVVTYPFTGIINPSLRTLELAIIGLTAMSLALTLFHVFGGGGTTRDSVRILLTGAPSKYFKLGVLALGLISPILLNGYSYIFHPLYEIQLVFLSGILVLVGAFLIRWTILKAGIYPPIFRIR